jgi:hypothetical protein
MSELFVVVCANNVGDSRFSKNGVNRYDTSGPLVWETYLRHATLDAATEKAKFLSRRYGKCRVAKLVFVDEVAE